MKKVILTVLVFTISASCFAAQSKAKSAAKQKAKPAKVSLPIAKDDKSAIAKYITEYLKSDSRNTDVDDPMCEAKDLNVGNSDGEQELVAQVMACKTYYQGSDRFNGSLNMVFLIEDDKLTKLLTTSEDGSY